MRHATVLLALALGVTGSNAATAPAITALAPFETLADGFGSVRGLAIDGEDAVYVADREAGTVTRLAAGARRVVARRLERPVGVAIDALGRVLVAEERAGRVVRLEASGTTPVAQGIKQPRWLAVSERGTLYISARRLRRDAEPEPDDESAEPEAILALSADGTLSIFADGFDHLQGLATRADAVYAATTEPRGVHRQGGVVYRIPVLPDGQAGEPTRVGPRDVLERPVGLALDSRGALYVSTPAADLGGPRSSSAIGKIHPDGTATALASGLDGPRGLALDQPGHLYVADGGRVLRFLAPAAPVLGSVPAFTQQSTVPLAGTTVPQARVDIAVNEATPPFTTVSSAAGRFAAAIVPAPNTATVVAVTATATRGKGLTSPAAEVRLVHDTLAPALMIQAPPASGFVRGTIEVRADAADAGSAVAALGLTASGQPLHAGVAPGLPAAAAVATAGWLTTGLVDGTHTLTAFATDRAGNTATVSRTVIVDNTPPQATIVSGPDGPLGASTATFTFAGSDGLTPASALRFAWRLDGGPLSPFTSDTSATFGGLALGQHLFEVLARDLAGNETLSAAHRAFSVVVAGPSLTITAPVDGASVPSGVLLVRGTVAPAGVEVGVSVNDVAALVHGGQWAAEIPIVPGPNVVTATASTTAGARTSITLDVSGSESTAAVTLRAEPSSGLAPLQVTWRVDRRTPHALVSFELDERGAGVFGAPLGALDGEQSTYPAAGLMFPTLRAVDDEGNVHVATTVVQVDDAQTASARFDALWAEFKARLQAGDQAGALAHLSSSLRSRFEDVFQRLGTALPGIAAGLGPVHLVDQVGDLAEVAILQPENDVTRLYFIYFRRDNLGQWLIQEM